MDAHARILDVTLRLFAESGYLGTTTRRIAQEADVNEVTLFRHFGSKDALIRAAIQAKASEASATLPADYDDPYGALCAWARAVYEKTHTHRTLIRRVMGEMVERPEIAPVVCNSTHCDHMALIEYLRGLQAARGAPHALAPEALAAMLLGSLFTDALWGDVMPEMPPPEVTIPEYIRALLLAMGLPAPAQAEAIAQREAV